MLVKHTSLGRTEVPPSSGCQRRVVLRSWSNHCPPHPRQHSLTPNPFPPSLTPVTADPVHFRLQISPVSSSGGEVWFSLESGHSDHPGQFLPSQGASSECHLQCPFCHGMSLPKLPGQSMTNGVASTIGKHCLTVLEAGSSESRGRSLWRVDGDSSLCPHTAVPWCVSVS